MHKLMQKTDCKKKCTHCIQAVFSLQKALRMHTLMQRQTVRRNAPAATKHYLCKNDEPGVDGEALQQLEHRTCRTE